MTQDITKLTIKNWQKRRNTIGEIAEGTEDIKQCIKTICTVRKGKIPFMPEFGTEIFEAIGENSDDAIDIITAILKKEIPKQEPRCEITDLTGTKKENGEIKITVYFREKNTGITDKQEVFINERY